MALILASGSPRRRELLSYYPIPLIIDVPQVDETPDPALSCACVAESLAVRKAAAVRAKRGDREPIIAADTVVVSGGAVLGKPSDKDDARRMIRLLSGKTHQVITGVALLWNGMEQSFSVSTDVTFKPLSEAEIEAYIATDEPYDKAGAYAIQGFGGFMVATIDGSYSNVVGLPVAETIGALQAAGFLVALSPAARFLT